MIERNKSLRAIFLSFFLRLTCFNEFHFHRFLPGMPSILNIICDAFHGFFFPFQLARSRELLSTFDDAIFTVRYYLKINQRQVARLNGELKKVERPLNN